MWQPIAKLYTSMQTVFVITVCWNAVNLIEETIKSVLSQTYPNVKYLIIDGGSTDGTVDIVKKYEDKLTYWVSEQDKGIYDAMNKGVSAAKPFSINGREWINFMNAGDTFADEKVLEDIFGNSAKQKVQESHLVIGGHTNRVYKDHTELLEVMPAEVLPHFIPFTHQSCFVRLNECNFDTRFKIAADYKILYDLYYREGAKAFLILERVISNYEMEDSLTFNNLKKAKGEYLGIQSAHRDWFWWKDFLKWKLL